MKRRTLAICMLWIAYSAPSLLGQTASDSLRYSSSLTIGGTYKIALPNQTNANYTIWKLLNLISLVISVLREKNERIA